MRSLLSNKLKDFNLFLKLLAGGRSKNSTGWLTKSLISFPSMGMESIVIQLPRVEPSVDLHVRVRAWRPSWWLVKDSKQGYTCLLYISQHRSGSILRHRTSLLHMWHVSIMRHEISPGCLRAARWAYRNRSKTTVLLPMGWKMLSSSISPCCLAGSTIPSRDPSDQLREGLVLYIKRIRLEKKC